MNVHLVGIFDNKKPYSIYGVCVHSLLVSHVCVHVTVVFRLPNYRNGDFQVLLWTMSPSSGHLVYLHVNSQQPIVI